MNLKRLTRQVKCCARSVKQAGFDLRQGTPNKCSGWHSCMGGHSAGELYFQALVDGPSKNKIFNC